MIVTRHVDRIKGRHWSLCDRPSANIEHRHKNDRAKESSQFIHLDTTDWNAGFYCIATSGDRDSITIVLAIIQSLCETSISGKTLFSWITL